MRTRAAGKLALGVLAAVALAVPATAGAASFTNPAAIAPDEGECAPLYPSEIAVSGVQGTVTDVNVTLHGLGGDFVADLGIALQAPSGQSLMLLDDDGGPMDTPADIGIDDSAGNLAPASGNTLSGSYKPTNRYSPPDTFTSPGPGTTYANPGPVGGGTATLASTFNGLEPNGTWKLWVCDFDPIGGNVSSITGGWTLDVSGAAPAAPAHPAAKKKKCKKKPKKRCKKKAKKKR